MELSNKEHKSTDNNSKIYIEGHVHHDEDFSHICLKRIGALSIFILVLIGSILLRIYYDFDIADVTDNDCFIINHEFLNPDTMYQILNTNETQLTTADLGMVNTTYWFETENGWNTSFIYCFIDGLVREYNNNTEYPVYAATWMWTNSTF